MDAGGGARATYDKKNPEGTLEETPLVNIAIPCLDEALFIERCLRDALAQNYPADRLEVVVADGGSRDGTREILAALARADRRVRVIETPDASKHGA